MKEKGIHIDKEFSAKFKYDLSRRDFLKAMGAFATAGALGLIGYKESKKDPTFGVELDNNNELSFKEARDLTSHFDKIIDLLPEPTEELNRQSLNQVVVEVTEYFKYENAVGRAMYPTFAEAYPMSGDGHIHIAGKSDCKGFVLNYSYANPMSSRYSKSSWIHTAIHEMAHVQQGNLCKTESSINIETTAQIVSLEIMAGMINYGNKKMIYPLLNELRGMASGTTWGIAIREGKIKEYDRFRKRIDSSMEAEARYQKSKRFWQQDPSTLTYILKAYSEEPLEKVMKAIRIGDNDVYGLALPRDAMAVSGGVYALKDRVFKVDDLAYFIKNAESIVREYARERSSQVS